MLDADRMASFLAGQPLAFFAGQPKVQSQRNTWIAEIPVGGGSSSVVKSSIDQGCNGFGLLNIKTLGSVEGHLG
jgi:hypothetical protein